MDSKTLIMPPRFLTRGNASTILSALETILPALNVENLVALTAAVDVVVLFLGSDLAGSCHRAKEAIAELFRTHNELAMDPRRADVIGVVVLVDGHCAAHVLHRELEHTFAGDQLVGRLFATACLPSTRTSGRPCLTSFHVTCAPVSSAVSGRRQVMIHMAGPWSR